MNAIEARNLCKTYGDFSLRDLSLTLPSGSIMGLVGENGAGKTTFAVLFAVLAIIAVVLANVASVALSCKLLKRKSV